MKIVDGEAIPIRIPLNESFTITSGTLTHTNQVLVRLTDDQGRVGWGETTAWHATRGYDQKSLYNVLTDYLLPAIRGMDPRNVALLHDTMDRAIPYNLMAKCGIDLASYDLASQAARIPMYGILGGKRLDKIPIAGLVGIVPPEIAAAQAREQVEKGAKTIKIKIGLDADDDLARVEAVRKILDRKIKIRVDCNQGYNRVTALHVLDRMQDFALEWVEQPLPAWDLEGMAMLAQRQAVPLAVDESVYTIHDAYRAISMRAADVVNIKVTKCGGIFKSQQIADVCASAGVPCFLGSSFEMTPGTAAAAHFYAATSNVISAAEIIGPTYYLDDVVDQPILPDRGFLKLCEAPGLGVVIDEKKIALYRKDF